MQALQSLKRLFTLPFTGYSLSLKAVRPDRGERGGEMMAIKRRPDLAAIPEQAGAIPSINLATVYDPRYARDDIQYGTIAGLAEILGRRPIAHRHDDFLQVHLVERGAFELMLDTTFFEASGPALFLTPPTVPHTFSFNPDARGHVLTVRQDIVAQIAAHDHTLPGLEALRANCVELRGEDGRKQYRELSLLFRLLQSELSENRQGTRAACEGLARTIVAKALRAVRPVDDAPGARRDLAHYRRFLQLVERHYREHRPIGFFADLLGMTEWRLYGITAGCGGATPRSILRERLLQEAKRQLALSDVSIKEVAAYLGFADAPYFCRVFRRGVGQTPSQYRARVHEMDAAQKSPIISQPQPL